MYNTRSQMAFVIHLRKTITVQGAVSFLGLKIWSKISHSVNNMKMTMVYDDGFLHTYSEESLIWLS